MTVDSGTGPAATPANDRPAAEDTLALSADRRTAAGLRPEPGIRLAPGEIVEGTRYRIRRWLGQGGVGMVFEALHVDTQHRVALKILPRPSAEGPDAVREAQEEARAANRVASQYIVDVYDLIELPDRRLAMAMELLEGITLERASADTPMSAGRAIGILRQICKALQATHAMGIVHGDIKPANVSVQSVDRADRVKLLDFGVAAALAVSDGGQIHGTPTHMAPEVALGDAPTPRSDIYSLGCTAYEILAGRRPFVADSVDETLRMQIEDVPRPIAELPGVEVPVALAQLVMECLEKDPEDRIADAVELEARLCEAQIAGKLQSPWDALPLPALEEKRRDFLLEHMPDPHAWRRPSWSRTWVLAAGLVAATAATLAAFKVPGGTADVSVARTDIEEMVVRANEAAARGYYVYPPPDDTQRATALTEVVSLEEYGGGADSRATEAAVGLRQEFAETLIRLGDTFWEREGGQPFATDYYVQALLFDRDRARARERAQVTIGELATLRRKSVDRGFGQSELIAAEPLLVLSESDGAARDQKLAELLQRTGGRTMARANLEAVLGRSAVAPERPAGPQPAVAVPSPLPDPSEEPVRDPLAKPAVVETSDSDDSPVAAADPESAAKLARRGEAAVEQRKWSTAETLFSRALAADDRNVAALVGLSDIHFERSSYHAAARYAKRAAAIAPHRAQIRIRLGDAYFKVSKFEHARTQYGRAGRLGHEDAERRLQMVRDKLGR